MAQCEKILDDGERCSNQAIPGTRYCKTHKRIPFRRVGKPADTAPPPSPEPPSSEPPSSEPPPAAAEPAPELRARPSAPDEAITFPGLVLDQRHLLVAPEGVVWLAADREGPPGEPFDRLVRCLSFLSQALELPGHIRILLQDEDGDSLLLLTPEPGHTSLSSTYDVISAAARLVEGRLYDGRGSEFIQYRDDRAPRGYDVAEGSEPAAGDGELLLVARWGSRRLRLADFDEVTLAELVCQVAPVAPPAVLGTNERPPAVPLEEAYALVPPALYPLLARYFRAHHLRYGVARLEVPPTQRQEGASDGELILLEIRPRPGALAGPMIPSFVLDYLSRFPRLSLLATGHRSPRRHVLVQYGRRHPFDLPHVEAAFDDDELVLLQTGAYTNLRARPAPHFFEGDRLSAVHAPQVASPERLVPRDAGELAELRLPILLRPAPGPVPPIAALVLSLRELDWLRRLLYRQPGEAFADLRALVAEDRALLVGDKPIEGIPFGLPLRRRADSGLFLPLRSRFVPELPWALLTAALDLRDGVYTFLTNEERFDVPVADFAPLSRALVSDPSRPPVTLKVRAKVSAPELRWTPPATPPVEIRRPRQAAEPAAPTAAASLPTAPAEIETSPLDAPEGTTAYLRRQAVSYEDEKDYLAAAVCYGLVHDSLNSARCYRRAAREMAPA